MKKYILVVSILTLFTSLSAMDTQESSHTSTVNYQELEQWFAPIMGNQQHMQQVAFILCIRERLFEAYIAEKIAQCANRDVLEWDRAIKDFFNAQAEALDTSDDTIKNLLLSADNALEEYGSPFTFKDFSLLIETRKECADALYAYGSTISALNHFLDKLQVTVKQLEFDKENTELKVLLLIRSKVKQSGNILNQLVSLISRKIEYLDLNVIKPETLLREKDFYQSQVASLASLNEFSTTVLPRTTLTSDQRWRIDRYVAELISHLNSVLHESDRFIKLLDGLKHIGYDLQKYATQIYENATLLKKLYAHWYHQLYTSLSPEYKTIAHSSGTILSLPETIFLINQLLSKNTSKDYQYAIQTLESITQTHGLIYEYSQTAVANSPSLKNLVNRLAQNSDSFITGIDHELTGQELKLKKCSNKMKHKVESFKQEQLKGQFQAQANLSNTLSANCPLIKYTFFDLHLWDLMYATYMQGNQQLSFEWMEPTWHFILPRPQLKPVLEYYVALLKQHQAHVTLQTEEPSDEIKAHAKNKKSSIKGKDKKTVPKIQLHKAKALSTAPTDTTNQEESSCSTPLPARISQQASTSSSTLKQFANFIRSLLVSSDTVLHRSDDYIAIRQHRGETTNEAMTLIIYNNNAQSPETLPAVKLTCKYEEKRIRTTQDNAWDRFHTFSTIVDRYLERGCYIDYSNQNTQANTTLMAHINLNQLDKDHCAYVIPGKIMGKYYDHTRALADRDTNHLSGFSGAFVYIFDKTTSECVHRCFHESNSSKQIKR
jgi:hypothetical protein